jgi:retron-type reverse transcriptase
VEIPKADGSMSPLGIPTVADRIAQEVARRYLEPRLEPVLWLQTRPFCDRRRAHSTSALLAV